MTPADRAKLRALIAERGDPWDAEGDDWVYRASPDEAELRVDALTDAVGAVGEAGGRVIDALIPHGTALYLLIVGWLLLVFLTGVFCGINDRPAPRKLSRRPNIRLVPRDEKDAAA